MNKYSERKIATEVNCLEILQKFYPNQDASFIETRIANTEKNSHMYFRSFPPLFYKTIQDLKLKHELKDILQFKAIMAGDSHMENFGIKFFKGKLRLSVNDYDDLTEGPIFLDIVRLLTSAKIAGLKIDKESVEELLKVYMKGVRNKDYEYSSTIKFLIEKANKLDPIDEKEISLTKNSFKKKRANSRILTEQEKAEWSELLSNFGQSQDSYSYIKDYGGSAGLNRYEFVVNKDRKTYWIEAKEWSTPSYNIAEEVRPPTENFRYESIITYDAPEIPPQLTQYNGKTYYIRNIDRRQLGIVLEEYNKKEMKEILKDEMHALGDFHRYYITHEKDYTKELKNLNIDDLLDIVNKIEKSMSKKMEEAK